MLVFGNVPSENGGEDVEFRIWFQSMLMVFDFLTTMVPNLTIKFGKDSHGGLCKKRLIDVGHRFYHSKHGIEDEIMEGFGSLDALKKDLAVRETKPSLYAEGLTKDKCKCCCCNTYRISRPDVDASKSHHKMSWFHIAKQLIKNNPESNIVVLFFEEALDTINQYENSQTGVTTSFFKEFENVQNMHILRFLYKNDDHPNANLKQEQLDRALYYGRKEMHGFLNQETLIHNTRNLNTKLFELYGLYGINYLLTEEIEASFDREILKTLLTFKQGKRVNFDENLLDNRDIFDNDPNILKYDSDMKRYAGFLRETNPKFKSMMIAVEETKNKIHSVNIMYHQKMNNIPPSAAAAAGDRYDIKGSAVLAVEEWMFNNTPGPVYRERWQQSTMGFVSVRPICYFSIDVRIYLDSR